jgi:hypothetical protein
LIKFWEKQQDVSISHYHIKCHGLMFKFLTHLSQEKKNLMDHIPSVCTIYMPHNLSSSFPPQETSVHVLAFVFLFSFKTTRMKTRSCPFAHKNQNECGLAHAKWGWVHVEGGWFYFSYLIFPYVQKENMNEDPLH